MWRILHEKGVVYDADDRAGRRARPVRPRRRARNRGHAVRDGDGRGGPAADIGPTGRPRASSTRTASIEGWVGGSCAQPVVVREALRSLADGQPRLLRLSKDAPAEGRRGDGVVELVMTCHSGGTLEIYVEPHLPGAGAVGRRHDSHRAARSSSSASAAGWRVTLFDPIADAEAFPAAERVSQRYEPRARRPGRRAVRRRRDPGHLGRGGAGVGPPTRRGLCRPRRVADPRRRRARSGSREEAEVAARTTGRPARARGPRPRRRDAGRDRALDPRRAGPGPTRPRHVRRGARPGDDGRRIARRVARPTGAGRRRHRPASIPSAA